ncbi:MAG: glycosyltransferase family 9 protein [Verrucomicrobiota bacterium]
MKQKILVLELWGLGDLTFSTVLIEAALQAGHEVHLVGKNHAKALLAPTFPSLRFFSFEAGWTKFHKKYYFWQWNWSAFFALLKQLHKEHYDVIVSARDDPRDHLLMALIGTRKRYGFAHHGSGLLLTHCAQRTEGVNQHKVEDWRDLGAAIGIPNMRSTQPRLRHASYRSARVDAALHGVKKPLVALHPGARIAVRRWPEPYFQEIIQHMRQVFDFHLILIPDLDGFGSQLAPLADTVLNDLTLAEMVDAIGRSHLLLCNDSGPAHLAAACDRPAIAMFGPTQANWFRPWGAHHRIVSLDICPHRPCFDYCLLSEPYCLTKLLPSHVWPGMHSHVLKLIYAGILPDSLLQTGSPAANA